MSSTYFRARITLTTPLLLLKYIVLLVFEQSTIIKILWGGSQNFYSIKIFPVETRAYNPLQIRLGLVHYRLLQVGFVMVLDSFRLAVRNNDTWLQKQLQAGSRGPLCKHILIRCHNKNPATTAEPHSKFGYRLLPSLPYTKHTRYKPKFVIRSIQPPVRTVHIFGSNSIQA